MLKPIETCWIMLKQVYQCWTMLNDVEPCWNRWNYADISWNILKQIEIDWNMLKHMNNFESYSNMQNYKGWKACAMPDISRSLDHISDLIISLAGESTPHHCHIFCLPQTFQLLKITASRKSTPYISVKPFNGAARSDAFRHSQRPES
jgi:hypothetical protein